MSFRLLHGLSKSRHVWSKIHSKNNVINTKIIFNYTFYRAHAVVLFVTKPIFPNFSLAFCHSLVASNRLVYPSIATILACMQATTYSILLADETATEALAGKLCDALLSHRKELLCSGFSVRLDGNLGAGKTTFTRAFLRAARFQGRVKSPTFELVEDYDLADDLVLHHFDFYRFESPEEFEDAGFLDLFGPGQIVFSEWSEKAEPYLPAADLVIALRPEEVSSRRATLTAATELGHAILAKVAS